MAVKDTKKINTGVKKAIKAGKAVKKIKKLFK